MVDEGLSNILPSAPRLVTEILAGGFQREPDICSRVPFGLFFWVLFLQGQEKYRLRLFHKEKFLLNPFLSLVKEKGEIYSAAVI